MNVPVGAYPSFTIRLATSSPSNLASKLMPVNRAMDSMCVKKMNLGAIGSSMLAKSYDHVGNSHGSISNFAGASFDSLFFKVLVFSWEYFFED